MKVDKESFLKYHFWYLLGLLVPLIFLAMILLWSGSASASVQEKKLDDKKKELQAIAAQNPKNPKWLEVLGKKEEEATLQETKLWKEMWDKQADLWTWPPALKKYHTAPFGSKIEQKDRLLYTKEDQYLKQIPEMLALVQPLLQGHGVVQCPNDDWPKLLNWKQSWNNQNPSAENIWLAQEDLWLKRELLRVVRDANDMAAFLEKATTPPKPDKSHHERDRQRFTSPTWQLDLALASKDTKPILRYRLTNISPRKQSLGIYFLIGFKGTKAQQVLFVDDEPLAPNSALEKEDPLSVEVELANPSGLDSVSQIFDWKTAPVKRIDKLEIGVHCPRTEPLGLKEFPFEALKADPATQGVSTEEGFKKNRYCEILPQVRRVPVAMLLVVDQNGIQDVLTAFANSKLQIQTTLWHWQRFEGNIKPKAPPSPKAQAENRPPPTPESGGVRGEFGEGPIRGGRGGFRPGPAAAPPPPKPTAEGADDHEFQLVELAIYGIASLYENPTAPAQAPAPAKPAANTAPPPNEEP